MTRVLLVENHRAFAAKVKQRLDALGCSVSWVTTAEDCFRAASGNTPPHMILVSAELTPVSGVNLCNGLKGDPKLRHVPLVIMSAQPLAALQKHSASPTRADAYVQKGDDLRDVVARFKAPEDAPAEEAAPPESEPTPLVAQRERPPAQPPAAQPPAAQPPAAQPPAAQPPAAQPPAAQPPADETSEPEARRDESWPESEGSPAIEVGFLELEVEVGRLERALAAQTRELALERQNFEHELFDQQAEWAAAVAAARKDQAAAVKRAEAGERECQALAAEVSRLTEELADVASAAKAAPVPAAAPEGREEPRKGDGRYGEEYVEELERGHAAELAERERVHATETQRLEEALERARTELEEVRVSQAEAANAGDDEREELRERAEQVEALEQERSRLVEKLSQLQTELKETRRAHKQELAAADLARKEQLAAAELTRKEDREAYDRELAERDLASKKDLVELEEAHAAELERLRRRDAS